jgi:ornithine cyclodeaminase/alanine dehydrogenase
MKTLVLTRKDVEALLPMEAAVEAVTVAFRAHGEGRARMPPKVYLSLPEHGGDFRAMPSAMDGAAGVKWVNSHPDNPARHALPSVMGVYVLSDPATALPLAVMDATWLTAVRTGAAGAVASRALGRKGARTLGLVGCGVQARVLLAAHRVLFDGLEVLCADVRPEAAAALAAEAGGRVATIAEAAGCDLVCTSTPGRAPVVTRAMLREGAHVSAMGADAPGKQELETDALRHARIFVDDWEQALHSGEVNVPIHDGALRRDHVCGTLGEVLAGKVPGRTSDAEITLFDSTGLAVQDLACARVVVERARREGRGFEVDLVG